MTFPTDDRGNPQVDFVWGPFPLQPNDQRGVNTLDFNLDNHIIADIGWSNYPSFIPNYSGDEDSGLEYIVPDLIRKTLTEADALLDNHNTNLNLFATPHHLGIGHITVTGKTVRVYGYDSDSWNDGQGALNGLKVGDQLVITNLSLDAPITAPDFGTVKVTKLNDEGETPATYFEFKLATALDDDFDVDASGSVYAGPNLVDVVTLQRFWNAAGSIKNPGTNIHVSYFEEAPAVVTFTPGNGYDNGFISSSSIQFTNYSNALLAALGTNTGETWTVTASYNGSTLGSYTVGRTDFASFNTIAGFDGLNGMPGGLRAINAVDVNSGAKTMTVYVGAGQM